MAQGFGVASGRIILEIGQAMKSVETLKGGLNDLGTTGQQSFGGFAQAIKNHEAQIQSWGKNLLGIGGIITGAIATPIALGSKAAWGQVDAVEQATVALRAYEKDGDKVNAVLSDLIGYAQSDMGVLFQRQDLFAAAQGLKVMGAETDNLSGYVEIMSRSVGLGTGNWDELSRVIGRVGSTGRMTGDDFDMLTKMGYQLDDSLRNTNMTWEELFTHLDKGIPADALAGQADTIRGKSIRLQSALRGLGLAFLGVDADTSKFIEGGLGDTLVKAMDQARSGLIALRPAAEVFGSAVATIARHASSAVDWLLRLPQPIVTAVTVMTGLAGVAMMAAGSFLLFLPRIADTVLALQRLGGLTGILSKLGSALRVVALTNPLFWVLAAAIGAVMAYRRDFMGFGRAVDRAFKSVERVVEGVVDVFSDLVFNFQQFRRRGVDPVVSGILALGAVFPGLRAVLQPLIGVVQSLQDAFSALRGAFSAFMDGDFDLGFARVGKALEAVWDAIVSSFEVGAGAIELAFEAIGRAAGAIGGAVMDAIRAIDWSAVGGALLSGLESLIAFVAGFVLNLGSIAVSVAGWIADRIPDVWAWLRDTAIPAIGSAIVSLPSVAVSVAGWLAGTIPNIWSWLQGIVIGGTKGDGTGGPMASSVGGITLGEVMASVGRWARGTLPDIARDILAWIGTVTVTIGHGLWNLSLGRPFIEGDLGNAIDQAIEGVVGRTAYYSMKLTIRIVDWAVENPYKAIAGLSAVVAAFLALPGIIAAAPVVVPVLLAGAKIAAAAGFTALVFNGIKGWFEANPVEAVEVLVPIQMVLQNPIRGLDTMMENTIPGQFKAKLDLLGLALEHEWNTFWDNVLPDINISMPSINWPSMPSPPDWMTTPPQWWTNMREGRFPWDDGGPGAEHEGWENVDPGGGGVPAAEPTPQGTPVSRTFDQLIAKMNETRTSANLMNTEIGRTPGGVTAIGSTGSTLSAWSNIGKGAFDTTGIAARTNLSPIGGMAASMAAALTGAAIPAFTGVQSSAGSNFASMLSSARSNFSGMKSTASSESSSMNRSVAMQALGMRTAALLQMATMKTTSALHFTSMASTSREQATAMANAMRRGASDAASAVSRELGRVPGIISNIGGAAASAARSVGVNIGDSMARGMESMLGRIQGAAASMVAAASAALIAKAMIGSPSKLFMGHGHDVGAGFEIGMLDTLSRISRAGDRMVMAAVADMETPAMTRASALFGNGSAGGGNTYVTNHPVTVYAVASDEWAAMVAQAEKGGRHAEAWQQPDGPARYLGGRR